MIADDNINNDGDDTTDDKHSHNDVDDELMTDMLYHFENCHYHLLLYCVQFCYFHHYQYHPNYSCAAPTYFFVLILFHVLMHKYINLLKTTVQVISNASGYLVRI